MRYILMLFFVIGLAVTAWAGCQEDYRVDRACSLDYKFEQKIQANSSSSYYITGALRNKTDCTFRGVTLNYVVIGKNQKEMFSGSIIVDELNAYQTVEFSKMLFEPVFSSNFSDLSCRVTFAD